MEENMKKPETYRTWGLYLFIFSFLGILLVNCKSDNFRNLISNPMAEFFPFLYGVLASIAFHPFLWLGIFLFWKADKMEKSPSLRWVKIIKTFGIFTLVMFLITAYLLLTKMNLRGSGG